MLIFSRDLPTDIAFEASDHCLKIEQQELIRLLKESFIPPNCEALSSVVDAIIEENVKDSPRLRHWLTSTRALLRSHRQSSDIDAFAVGHFLLDQLDPSRFMELHYARALEIVLDDRIKRRAKFEMFFSFSPPLRLGFGVSGGELQLEEEFIHFDAWSICSDGASVVLQIGEAKAVLDIESRNWSTQGAIRAVRPFIVSWRGHIIEIPYYDAALTDAQWCRAPVLRARPCVQEWSASLLRGFDVLASIDESVAHDCARLINACVPLHVGSTSYGSASPEDLIGISYLPALDSANDLAESILHEALHQKLYRIESSVHFFNTDSPVQEVYYSPWRTDGRPLRMVLHGAYVFTAVAELWSHLLSRLDGDELLDGSFQVYYRASQAKRAALVIKKFSSLSKLGLRIIDPIDVTTRNLLDKKDYAESTIELVNNLMKEHELRYSAFLH